MQDEITSHIAIALDTALVTAEATRPTKKPDALDYIFRGRAAGWRPPSRDKYAEQIGLLEHALELDPRSSEARSILASALMSRVVSGMSDSAAVDIAHAQGLVGQALAASPSGGLAHFAKGQVPRAQRRFEEAGLAILSARLIARLLHLALRPWPEVTAEPRLEPERGDPAGVAAGRG